MKRFQAEVVNTAIKSKVFLRGEKKVACNEKIGRVKCDNKRTQQEILDTSVDWNA